MFGRARWRLTLWFAGVLAVILAVLGAAVFLTARAVLFDQVNDDLVARAERESRPLAERLLQRFRGGQTQKTIEIGPAFTAGGYFYAVVTEDGTLLGSTPNTDPDGLPDAEAFSEALDGGPTFVDTRSSEGEHLRVYLLPVETARGRAFLMEVGRSTEPERQALRRLLLVLAAGGGAGIVLALGGGFLLSGRALRPIQTAMDSQRAFVADASHELRTPLALIRANAELLKRHPESTVEVNMGPVDDVIAETDRLSGLVGQMLTLARADAGEAPARVERVDLAEVARDAARQMGLLAELKGITIELNVDAVAMVMGDALRLRELLTILLDNAVKYSDNGAPVALSVGRVGDRILVTVADRGRGIPAEALPHIFERFYRADRARSRESGGAGLGLSIAKWIVEEHGGKIRIESAPGEGTTATAELPATT